MVRLYHDRKPQILMNSAIKMHKIHPFLIPLRYCYYGVFWLLLSMPHQIQALTESSNQGKLLIVGGGLRESNRAIHQAFIQHATREDGSIKIGIIPCASSSPVTTANQWKQSLQNYGVAADCIDIIPLAVKDDPTTSGVDESLWSDRASDPALVQQIHQCSAIWITGGDQTRLSRTLIREDGSDTPLLQALRRQFQEGMLIAGSSAGAAILGDPMIAGGSSDRVWFDTKSAEYHSMKDQEQGGLILAKGFGFFPEGLIDQHFDRKGRFARLLFATLQPAGWPIGYGIDEDTALLYQAADNTAQVIGSQHVFRIDSSKKSSTGTTNDHYTNIIVDFLANGDAWELETGNHRIHPSKKVTTGAEYMQMELSFVPSPLTPYSGGLADALSYLLLDNGKTHTLSLQLAGESGKKLNFAFSKEAESIGYWAALDGQHDSYSGIRLKLEVFQSPPD